MSNTWGNRLKEAREVRSMSQRAVAMEAEVPQSTINRIERGKLAGVNSTTAIKIAKVLGVSLDYLIAGKGSGPVDGIKSNLAKTDPCTFTQKHSWFRTLILHDGIVTYDSLSHKDSANAIEGELLLDRLDTEDRVALQETVSQMQPNQRPEPIMIKMNLIWHTAWVVRVEEEDGNDCILIQLSTISQSELQRQRFSATMSR